jgi:hypothetical protein
VRTGSYTCRALTPYPGLNFVSGLTLGSARAPRPFVQRRFSTGKRVEERCGLSRSAASALLFIG